MAAAVTYSVLLLSAECKVPWSCSYSLVDLQRRSEHQRHVKWWCKGAVRYVPWTAAKSHTLSHTRSHQLLHRLRHQPLIEWPTCWVEASHIELLWRSVHYRACVLLVSMCDQPGPLVVPDRYGSPWPPAKPEQLNEDPAFNRITLELCWLSPCWLTASWQMHCGQIWM